MFLCRFFQGLTPLAIICRPVGAHVSRGGFLKCPSPAVAFAYLLAFVNPRSNSHDRSTQTPLVPLQPAYALHPAHAALYLARLSAQHRAGAEGGFGGVGG